MRTALASLSMALAAVLAPMAEARTAFGGDTIGIQDMVLTVPDGYRLVQDAKDDGTIILGFGNGASYVTIFVKAQTGLDMRAIFQNDSRVVRDIRSVPRNNYDWKILETTKTYEGSGGRTGGTTYVASFMTEYQGHSYYGFARGSSSATALEAATAFLDNLE